MAAIKTPALPPNALEYRWKSNTIGRYSALPPVSVGGCNATARSLYTVETVDPATATFSPTTSLDDDMGLFFLALLRLTNAEVFALNGFSDGSPCRRTQTFDPVSETWTEWPESPGYYTYPVLIRIDDNSLLVVGGREDVHSPVATDAVERCYLP